MDSVFNTIWLGINNDSSGISQTVFYFIITLFLVDMFLYFFIFRRLSNFDRKLKSGDDQQSPLKDLLQDYREMSNTATQELNTEVFVEAYFSRISFLGRLPLISTLKFIQNTVSIFILIGVLGTFVGIYTSLVGFFQTGQNISAILSDLDNLAPLLQGMGTAFATSIVGMSFSLLTSFIIKFFNAEQYIVGIMTRLENQLDNKLGTEKESFLYRTFRDLKNTMQDGFDRLYSTMSGLDNFSLELEEAAAHMKSFNHDLTGIMGNLKELYRTNEEFTKDFVSNIRSLNHNFDRLFTSMNEITKQQIELRSFIENINEIQSDNLSLLGNIQQDIMNSQISIKKQTAYMESINSRQEKLFVSFKDLDDSIIENLNEVNGIYRKLGEIFKNNSNGITRMQNSNQEWIKELKGVLKAEEEETQENLDKIYQLYEKVGSRQDEILDRYQDVLAFMETMQTGFAAPFKDNLAELKETMESLKGELARSSNETNMLMDKYMGDMKGVMSAYLESAAELSELKEDLKRDRTRDIKAELEKTETHEELE